MKLEEDLDLFVKSEFSSIALIDGVEVSGIFDEHYQQSFDFGSNSGNLPTENREFTFKVRSDEIGAVNHGSSVEFPDSSRLFEVIAIQPIYDGKFSNLVLKEL